MASVSLRNASKVYGGLIAVNDMTLDIAEGEFVVFLGPSGCGKTTTLRMIAGFVQPTAGNIFFGSENVTNLPPRNRNIGMVFQNYALFPNMTVAENVGFGLKERKLKPREINARVEELLNLVQLSGREGAYIDQLSGGQQQRVALARALAVRPRVLLMDEPLAALDLKLRESMQAELHRLQRNLGITTILVTHDQREAMSLSDRIVIMSGGEIQQVGTPEELYSVPRNKFVADFIGKTNVLYGEVTSAESGSCTVRLDEGDSIEITPDSAYVAGQRLEVSVRPEEFELTSRQTSPCLNMMPGTVESRRFLGNVIYYSVRLSSGRTVLVERSAAGEQAKVGEQISICWKPERTVAFSTEGKAPVLNARAAE